MAKKKLKIIHIASEVEPFTKSGGLASIVGSLPKAHHELGYKVSIVTPFYEGLVNKNDHNLREIGKEDLEIDGCKYKLKFLEGRLNSGNIPVYFVANKKFFGKRENLYGAKAENSRFFFFNLAVLRLIKKVEERPDVLHCHDWHTGLIPYFLKGRFRDDPFWSNTATLFTIHNLAYQFGHDWWTIPGEEKDNGRTNLPKLQETKKVERINFAKRAILSANAINTVSETYREEIMTKHFGEDLHRILKNRENRVFGVVNGIDYEEYNPATDPGLFKGYTSQSINLKRENKKWMQRRFKLKVDEQIPVICMTSRVAEQKGFEILLEILPTLLKQQDIQVIIMGDGNKKILSLLKKIQKKIPKKIAIIPFNKKYETSLYAGSDMFLLPSRFEPCGINQMIALRYGCIPIAHHIGGLADTVVNFNPIKNTGNGFVFREYSSFSLLSSIVRALETYKYKDVWENLVISGMQEANSWKIPAQKYIDLYKTTIKLKKENGENNKY